MPGTVLVMAKSPIPGRVKTRLCPPCTPAEAAAIAEAALADTLDAVALSSADRRVVALDGSPGAWLPGGFEVVAQRGAGLDERLERAWREVQGPAVQIGMDTPQVTPQLLDDALDIVATGAADAVLGLADDGGWWAVGFARAPAGAFAGIAMSRADTGTEQLARLRSLGLRVVLLPVLRDIDTYDDSLAVTSGLSGSRTALAVAEVRLAQPA